MKNTLLSYEFENDESSSVQMYDELRDIRDDYIALMNVSPYASACISFLSDSFESIFLELKDMPRAVETIMKRTLIHELFIYLVAICYKNGLFEELGHLLNRSYYIGEYENEFGNYRIFYTNNDYLDKAICKKDNKNYFSGTANYWIETLDVNTCTKREFVMADVLCFNVSIFLHNGWKDRYWFPLTYVYSGDNYNSLFKLFALGLKSKEKLKTISVIFGYNTSEDFIRQFKAIQDDQHLQREISEIRYNSAFVSPQTLFQFVSVDDIGSLR